MNKVTKEIKEKIISMRKAGLTLKAIGIELGISDSTVAYHSSADYKKKTIARAIKNRKPQTIEQKEATRKYNKEYQSKKYKNDSDFREKNKSANRENQKKKRKENNGKQ